ncbi:hypothetical protein BDV10DRAFT_105217 [Aspergillus recurvatus]
MPRTYGKSRGKAKQTRLAFVPAGSTSERNDNEGNSNTSRNANVRYTNPSLGTLRSSRSTSSREKSSTPKPFVKVEWEPSPEDVDVEMDSQRSEGRKGEKKSSTLNKAADPLPPATQDSDSGNDSDSEIAHSACKSRRTRSMKPQRDESPEPTPVGQDSDSDLEVIRSARKKTRDQSMKRKGEESSVQTLATQNSDSDLEVIHSARKPARNRNLKRKRTDFSEPEDRHISDDSEAEEVVARPHRKLRRRGAPQPIVVDDDSDEEQEVCGGTSKSPSIPRTPRRDSSQDRIDIEEDLEDLQDSVVKASRTRGNIANSARAQRQLHLEALRRRRAGKREEGFEEDQLSPQPEASDSENSNKEGGDEKEAPVRQPHFRNWANESESSDVESTIGANEDLDRYEDDFVLEDEDDKLGVPSGLEEMPIEFSRHAYKQLKDYFQDAVEWMVHNQLNPAFPRSDPVFRVAFDKLEAEVRGRTGSQLVSSVWNTDFRRALLARPHIEVTTYPIDLCHSCDACNRSGHPASFDMKLYGKAYSLETLEPLADADSDEGQSENEEDEQERDRDGYILPDEDTRFYLGRHCKKNAALAHTLTHWRFHLNEWVVEHLRTAGYFSDKKILKRSQYSQKKKNKHAAKAVNKMIESGEIKKLWRDFHINLRAARESTV